MLIEVPDSLLKEFAAHIAANVELPAGNALPQWMRLDEAVEYTKIPKGTFEKMAADGFFKAHGGKTKVYDRDQLTEALRGYAASPGAAKRPIPLRKAS